VPTDTTVQYAQLLDPYLDKFVDYLDGKYLKVTIVTLRCLIGFLKFRLPSLEKHSKMIAVKLFNLLKTYSASSAVASTNGESTMRGDNFELLMICYKVISNLIRDCQTFNLDEDQLQVLMYYAERNLYDSYKQAAAFNLLKSILSRKLQCPELHDVLGKVMKLSIQADAPSVRLQSRQTILQYILDYSLTEKKLLKFLEFYIVQLNYEYENGRESALEMLATVFNTFPTVSYKKNKIVKSLKNIMFFFYNLTESIKQLLSVVLHPIGHSTAQRRVGKVQEISISRIEIFT
jgi:U3 small nucleolar RNA-associated protein 20